MIVSQNLPSLLPILVTISFLTGSIADIDRSITDLVNLRLLYPRTHPEHINCVYDLVNERWARYELSGDKQDRDKYLVHCTEAILLPPVSPADHSNNVVQLLFTIAETLLECMEESEQPEGIKHPIQYLRYLRGLALDSFDVSRNDITKLLLQALGSQVGKSEASRDRIQNINEMLALCRELLTSNLSADFPVAALHYLSKAIEIEFLQGRAEAQLADQVVECVRDAAKKCSPDSHFALYELAVVLRTRFAITHSIDDYEEATAILDRILDPNQPGVYSDQIRDEASSLAIRLSIIISSVFPNPQYSEATVRSTLTLLMLQRQISTTQRTRTRSRSRYPHLRLPLRSTLAPWSCFHLCSPPYLFPFVPLFPFDMLIARHVCKSSRLGAWNIQYPSVLKLTVCLSTCRKPYATVRRSHPSRIRLASSRVDKPAAVCLAS